MLLQDSAGTGFPNCLKIFALIRFEAAARRLWDFSYPTVDVFMYPPVRHSNTRHVFYTSADARPRLRGVNFIYHGRPYIEALCARQSFALDSSVPTIKCRDFDLNLQDRTLSRRDACRRSRSTCRRILPARWGSMNESGIVLSLSHFFFDSHVTFDRRRFRL